MRAGVLTSEAPALILVYMATNQLPAPDVTQDCGSWKGKQVAFRRAAEYASMNDGERHEVDEVFYTRQWNGSGYVDLWLQYTVEKTFGGWVIVSNRWYSNPEA